MYNPLPLTLLSATKPNSGKRLSLLTSRLSPATKSSPGGIFTGPNSLWAGVCFRTNESMRFNFGTQISRFGCNLDRLPSRFPPQPAL